MAYPLDYSSTSNRVRSSAMSAGQHEVDVKLRIFIPAPVIEMPVPFVDNRYFSGDGRGFQYSGGTSRAEMQVKRSSRAPMRNLTRMARSSAT